MTDYHLDDEIMQDLVDHDEKFDSLAEDSSVDRLIKQLTEFEEINKSEEEVILDKIIDGLDTENSLQRAIRQLEEYIQGMYYEKNKDIDEKF